MKISVLFVCLGNICRSPLAMNMFIHEVEKRGLSNHFIIDSCGTSDYHIGHSPDERTIKNAARNGLTIKHEARQFSTADFKNFDYILVMDKSNLANVQVQDPERKYNDKVHLMRDYDPKSVGADVPDPYFGGEAGFQDVFDILERSINNFLDDIIQVHSLSGG